MTFVEFFTKTVSENICVCLARVPDRVILVGDKRKLLEAHALRYKNLFADRGHSVEFICRSVNKNHLGDIVEALTEIVSTYPDCVFDLTGGEDLYLVAVGIISARFPEKNIQMHRFNIRSGVITDCDQDDNVIGVHQSPKLSVEENIRAFGGEVVGCDEKPTGTFLWDMNEDFRADIRAIWRVCAKDVRKWNTQISVLEAADTLKEEGSGSLTAVVPLARLRNHMRETNSAYMMENSILAPLHKSGLLTEYRLNGDTLRITYKNAQVKRCLTKAGQALEMYIYLLALECRDSEGAPLYNDVMTGVSIDWDGEIHTDGGHDTENEIDVLLMHGIVPIFISCKNGFIEMDELYKLNTVAEQFGGQYAKRVLVASALETAGDFAEYLRARASAMNVTLLEGITSMTEEELQKKIRSLWNS